MSFEKIANKHHYKSYVNALRVEEQGVKGQGETGVASLRSVPEEMPVALSYGGTTHAVMMASPVDLEDFALGFSLSEQIVSQKQDIVAMDIVPVGAGIDIQIQLAEHLQRQFSARRRARAGPVGCGLCGMESIESIMGKLPTLHAHNFCLSGSNIRKAIKQLATKQKMRAETGAIHAAALIDIVGNIRLLREDIGRHNALDKLIGAAFKADISLSQTAIVITSRVSVDLVQKVAVAGGAILIAVSTPTALSVRTAEQAGLTLVALASKSGFEIYTHPQRISKEVSADVA